MKRFSEFLGGCPSLTEMEEVLHAGFFWPHGTFHSPGVCLGVQDIECLTLEQILLVRVNMALWQ